MQVLFTGGSGKAGKHVIPYLLNQGRRVMNVDQASLNPYSSAACEVRLGIQMLCPGRRKQGPTAGANTNKQV